MNVIVNGKPRDLPGEVTVKGLLEHFDLASERVAVEVNGRIVDREAFEDHVLREGDMVEVVRFVGGG
ncbi:MAG: sulfur carrier protein ThiS [Alicyclobacillus macrosporangiidus]|uniref:sulfur carrier protein ThiS n=1 Tax=Alicyclobacillus macrosporangiidus TaxID=392015 RepID=UPI0026F01D03|nr:sulfur carrier protein ThiS [Alicyclobacillus macrosporangiidus]MCL6598679.1 sulfur carrier protein ThiS [Alicyclobacillus macrosporangiidus]